MRVLVSVVAAIGAWVVAAGTLWSASVTLELLAWQPLHRGEYERAEPLLEVGVASSLGLTLDPDIHLGLTAGLLVLALAGLGFREPTGL